MSESDADGWTPLHFAAEVSQVHPCLQSTSLYIPFPPRKKEVGFMHSDLNALACIPEGLIWGMLCPATKCGPGHSLIVRPTPYLLPEAVRKGGVHFYHPNTHNVRAPSLPLFCAHHVDHHHWDFFLRCTTISYVVRVITAELWPCLCAWATPSRSRTRYGSSLKLPPYCRQHRLFAANAWCCMIDCFVAMCASVNRPDATQDGKTAYQLAVAEGHAEVSALLLEVYETAHVLFSSQNER